jgi:hypothetical protein
MDGGEEDGRPKDCCAKKLVNGAISSVVERTADELIWAGCKDRMRNVRHILDFKRLRINCVECGTWG